MGTTWRIGKLSGIPIDFDLSAVIVAVIIAITLATGAFPSQFPDFGAPMYVILGICASILLFASVLAHELSHALVAKRDGLEVEGITLFAFGGMAKLTEEPRTAREELRMAAAGPACSMLIGVLLIGALTLGSSSWYQSPAAALIAYLAAINIALGLFNLAPGFPLDGGRIFRALLWATTGDLRRSTWASTALGQAIALLLVFWGLLRIYEGVQAVSFFSAIIAGLFLILTGLFLSEAGRRSYQAVLQREAVTVEADSDREIGRG